MKHFAIGIAAALMASVAHAGPILILSGASQTSEGGTTSSIVANMTTLHQAVGNTVTVADNNGDVADLSVYSQVWDLRFSNSWALSTSEIDDYVAYMNGGGGMFVMGENANFGTRNSSIRDLAIAAGGGDIGNVSGRHTGLETVLAPFTGPNPLNEVRFSASGHAAASGTGDYMTDAGSGVAWGVGDLANAMAGALTTVFDVNFMQTNAPTDQNTFAKNLVNFVQTQVEPPAVPLPASLPLMLAGLGGLAVLRRRS